ncbi:MAG TPA: polysaccharide biosynthesis tyrosine autokinase [Candidatus Acidoferrales bacterium]|nr:polysaccharide biosynthesis tyrosine autokinase [Candidatus Acidoferrales bacterium]
MPNEKSMLALPAPEANGSVPVVPEYVTFQQPYGNSQQEPEEPIVPLSHYLWILRRHKWRISAFVLVCVASTVVVSSRLTPIYEATATIDIDRQAPEGFIGQDATRSAPNDADQFLATQVNAIQSDSVLRPVAEKFNLLDTTKTALPAARVQNAPVALGSLKVTRPPNTYLLLISYRSTNPELAANVANGIADSYIQHTYDIRFRATAGLSAFMEKQIEELKAKMERSSGAQAQFEKDLSVINPEEKTSILSARLLQLNAEFTTAQGDRVRKQAAYDSVKTGSLEAAKASTQGEQLRRLADHLDEAREKFVVVKTQYGASHPEYKKSLSQVTELERQFALLRTDITQRVSLEYQEAANREGMLKSAVAEIKNEFDHLNARFFEYKSLKREADGDKTLYDELVRKIKEAGINSSFQNSSIRLSDSARPPLAPVFPNQLLNAILAFLCSTLLAVGAAVVADVLDNTVRDPEQIQRGLKTVVLGSLPVVKSWRGKFLPVRTNSNVAGALMHSDRLSGQAAAFEEAIRTLRDSILLADLGRRPRSILTTSATPREGKTTTSVHLAIAHSLQNRKTLLIDADLRRPGVHGRLGLPNLKGMSTHVSGEIDWRDAIQKSEIYPDLDVITAGPASRRAADRLGGVLDKLLAEAEKEYDLVIVDGPPLLGFAEPLQMAAVVDGVVVITMAGQTNRNAVASVLNSLRRIKTNVIGVVLNEVRADMSDRYYYYGYYGKYYSKYYKPLKS